MWVEFVVGSRPCSERFFPGFSSFPFSSKTNISKFQFGPYSHCGIMHYTNLKIYLLLLFI